MNLRKFLMIACVTSLLLIGCDKKSSTDASTKATASTASTSQPASSEKEPVSGASTTSATKVSEELKSPAKADAEALKVLDFPTLKKMVLESKAKLTMIPVWATWCVPCIKEMPHLAEFYEKQHKNGLEMIALCIGDKSDEDDAEQMSDKIAELKSPFHHYVLPDESAEAFFKEFGKSYGGTLPATLVLDSKGEVVLFTRNGWTDESLGELIVPKLK